MSAAVCFKSRPRAEGRKSERRQSALTGKIVYQRGIHAFSCTIRDISATGARIAFAEAHIVPNQFYLIDSRSRVVHDVKVVWVAYSQRGVRFMHSYAIDQRLPPNMEFLKRY